MDSSTTFFKLVEIYKSNEFGIMRIMYHNMSIDDVLDRDIIESDEELFETLEIWAEVNDEMELVWKKNRGGLLI